MIIPGPWRSSRLAGALCVVASLLTHDPVAFGQDAPAGPPVDVFWKESATVHVPGLTQALALNDGVCRVDVVGDELRITGEQVGQTVLLVWAGSVRTSMVVVVSERPQAHRASSLSDSAMDAVGRGRAGASVMSGGAGDSTPLVTREYWDWNQAQGDDKLAIHGFTDTYSGAGRPFNLSSFTIQRTTRTTALSLFDFPLNLGASDAPPSALSPYGAFSVRGVDYVRAQGKDRLELFGGSTLPSYFLSFAGTRYVAGAKLDRALGPRVAVYGVSGLVAAPPAQSPTARRQLTPFQVAGTVIRPSPGTWIKASGGMSTRGFMGDADAEVTRGRFVGSVGATESAATFPLNQVQLLTAGETSARGMASLHWSRVATTSMLRHTVATPALTVLRGTSNSMSQNLAMALPARQQVSFNLTRNTSQGTVLPSSVDTRLDTSWSSPVGARASNSLQLGIGRNRESTDLNTYHELTVRDSASVAVPFGTLVFSFDRERFDPSMSSRVRDVVDTLPAPLQDLFRLDPATFLQTVDLPADVRQLLERVQPESTSFSIGGEVVRGRLALTPTFSIVHDSLAGEMDHATYLAGYSATWQLTSSLQLRSALSNQLRYTRAGGGFERSNVFTIGIDRSFTGVPRWLGRVAPKYTIEGHVFRDMDVDGIYDATKPGMPGVQVRLDDGPSAVTDRNGYYRLRNVRPGVHRVWIDVTQFRNAMRVTTPSSVEVEITDAGARVDFGVVDSARLLGTVFNDYANDGNRQSDAPGLPGVTVRIVGATVSTTTVTDGSGEYEVDGLPPGDYTLSASPDDLPADYLLAASTMQVHVAALATVVQDIPVRALRSIAGRVLLRASGDSLRPLEGVTVSAGAITSITDQDGRFALRGLPAGDVSIRVIPIRDIPQRLHAPFGIVKLSTAPTQIDSANIIITNPELVDYVARGRSASTVVSAK